MLQRSAAGPGKNTHFFGAPLYTTHSSFYQDGLGTNIGKALKKRDDAFSAGLEDRIDAVTLIGGSSRIPVRQTCPVLLLLLLLACPEPGLANHRVSCRKGNPKV